MAQVVSGGWIFNQTVPDAPTSGDIDYMITITELIEFVQVDVTISGTGEVGVSHTIDYTITNIAQAGQVLASGMFQVGFDPQNGDPDEIILVDQPIGLLNPTEFLSGSTSWTPQLIEDYRCFLTVYNLVWS